MVYKIIKGIMLTSIISLAPSCFGIQNEKNLPGVNLRSKEIIAEKERDNLRYGPEEKKHVEEKRDMKERGKKIKKRVEEYILALEKNVVPERRPVLVRFSPTLDFYILTNVNGAQVNDISRKLFIDPINRARVYKNYDIAFPAGHDKELTRYIIERDGIFDDKSRDGIIDIVESSDFFY